VGEWKELEKGRREKGNEKRMKAEQRRERSGMWKRKWEGNKWNRR